MPITIAEVEDRIIETIRGLGVFRVVESAGRKGVPATYTHPAAFVYFAKDANAGVRSRLVVKETYQVIVAVKQAASEEKAARTVYELTDLVRDAIHGANWGVDALDQMDYEGREIVEYEAGQIAYEMTFSVTHKYAEI